MVLIAHVLITAYGNTSAGKIADKPNHSSANRAFAENDLANANYRIDELGSLQLDSGELSVSTEKT
ncbi:MAG: hypothetical protein ACXW04_11800 [Methylobacter sp.]